MDNHGDQDCLTIWTWGFGRLFQIWTDGCPCPSVLFRRTFVCKNIFTNFFKLIGGYLITYVKPTCQIKIHGGQEKLEGARIRVRAGANGICSRVAV